MASKHDHTTLRYTQLGFFLTALLDKSEGVTPEEAMGHIDDGSLFLWLRERFGNEGYRSEYNHDHLSLLNEDDEREVLKLFQRLSSVENSALRFGTRHNGLALLAAYCFEGLQEEHYPPVR